MAGNAVKLFYRGMEFFISPQIAAILQKLQASITGKAEWRRFVYREADMEKYIEDAIKSIEREVRHILASNNVPRNTHKFADYEFGKATLHSNGFYDWHSMKTLADWVGV